MRVVVTGHRGFIGRHTVAALLEEGHSVLGVDKVSVDEWVPMGEGFHRVTSEGVDLGRASGLAWLRSQQGPVDAVIHLAATCSTPGSLVRPMETFDSTVRSAVHVLEWIRERPAPFLLTSSVKARDGMTPYGAAKQMVELWSTEMCRAFDIPLIITRPGTVYGPGQEGSPESGWIAWFLKARDDNLPVIINGDGMQQRDLLYVSDYVRLVMRQLLDPDRYEDEIWDVGGGPSNTVTVRGMADHLKLDYSHGPARYGDAEAYIGHNMVPRWEPIMNWRDSGMF